MTSTKLHPNSQHATLYLQQEQKIIFPQVRHILNVKTTLHNNIFKRSLPEATIQSTHTRSGLGLSMSKAI